MNKLYLLLGAFLIACSPQVETSQEVAPDTSTDDVKSDQIVIGEKLSLYSEVLGEDRPYWVHTPASYSAEGSTQAYPVLYLLDGDAHFHSATGVINFMSGGINGNTQIPELIVVTIPNTDRTRDLSQTPLTTDFQGNPVEGDPRGGGGDNFLKFIETELIPTIEADFRTAPHRTFVGHSLGGLIALHSFVTQPGLYNGYIAIDPSVWWDGAELLSRSQEVLPKSDALKGRIFISSADHNPEEPMLFNINGYKELLEGLETPSLQTAFKLYPGEDHGSVPLLSLYDGLLHVFDGFKVNTQEALASAEYLKSHYEKVTQMMGYDFYPPENLVNMIGGYVATLPDRKEKALEYYKLNLENYPNSSNTHSSVGTYYKAMGNIDLAREHFEKALELNPDNQAAIEGLKDPEAQ